MIDGRELRAKLVELGLLRPGNGVALTRVVETETPVLHLDDAARDSATRSIALADGSDARGFKGWVDRG